MRPLSYPHGPPAHEEAERMLAVPTRLIREARERNEALAALDLDAGLERLEHEWIPHRGLTIHLEVHETAAAAPSVVIVHGLGDHARRQSPLAVALAERGFNSIVLDRPGHGLSEGRRGDAPLETGLDLVELVIGIARSRWSGPVVLLGDSLGGIMIWYLLTREPDAEAAVCHCIRHPSANQDPAFRFKVPLLRALARIAPYASISVRQLADYEHVALDPVTKRYFDEEVDELFNFTVTARSAASYLEFEPAMPWERVETPVLVLIGAEDRMVTPRLTRESLERARPPRAQYLEIEGAGHQLFLDDLGAAIEPLAGWIETALGARADAAGR